MTLRCAVAFAILVTVAPVRLHAQSSTIPGKSPGFRLFAASGALFEVNRVECFLAATGEICSNPPGSGFVGGAWPGNTNNMYIFNSGPQIAGIVGSDGGAWAGDTTGAYFFNARGDVQHGNPLTPIYLATDVADSASWPAAGHVAGPRYESSLQGRIGASEGDAWWLLWDVDFNLLTARPHPLGVLTDVRVLAWNYPTGNEDILYLALTFYNISSLDPGAYAGAPAGLVPVLLEQAQRFHADALSQQGVTLPATGYTIENFHIGIGADMDVADAGVNYSSVNLPLALGYAWERTFSAFAGWQFDPAIFSPPFFVGSGLVGVKFLGGSPGTDVMRQFTNTTNGGGDFNDPRSVLELYSILSGNLTPSQLASCNFNPATTRICFIRTASPTDIRQIQSTGPVALPPGGSATVVAAYVFAPPVRTGSTFVCPGCDIKPGSLPIIAGLGDPAVVANGANPIDSIAGFLGASDLNGNGVLEGSEFLTVPRSLYHKAQVAQAIFDHQFLLPSAPAAPDFFLIPGDNQVTVIWRPSITEQTGDAFFTVAKDAQILNAQGVLVPNPLYDPNFRQFDVEGYRVYRGRVDDPSALTLVVAFDYAGTVISDYSGQVNPDRLCAPELGITSDCPIAFDPIQPGVARSAHVDIPLAGDVIQVRFGDRIPLPNNSALVLRADTTFVSGSPNCLCDTGVPFTYVDNAVRNNFRYFYSVTAFDINSVQSAPASFESSRILKSVTPVRPASNYQNTALLSQQVFGRGVALTDTVLPTLDPNTGIFSKKMPATNGWTLQLVSFVKEVIGATDSIVIRLDSMVLGSAYESNGACTATSGAPNIYHTTVMTATDTMLVAVPLTQDCFNGKRAFGFPFTAISIDPALASRYGGNGSFVLQGQFEAVIAGNYYTSAFGRGCLNAALGFGGGPGCDYNGARWFNGPSPANNETLPHPNACSMQNNTSNVVTCYNNAGALSGVATIHEVKSYQTTPNVWRNVEGVLGGAVRGADYNVYWGAGGVVDSVIDVSNNAVVPFDSDLREGASWGILNQSAATLAGSYDQRTELTITDFGCVPPFTTFTGPILQLGCAPGTTYQLNSIAIPGPIVFWSGPTTNTRSGCNTFSSPGCGFVAPSPGFAMYLAGHLFMFELAGGQLPASGTVWSMRDYIGAIRGGGTNCSQCTAGDDGPYQFTSFDFISPRTFAAVGAELHLRYDVVNQINAPTRDDLRAVHTVPDPYYLSNSFEADAGQQVIKFVNLPQDAVIRIYTSSGILVSLLEHHSTTFGGSRDWDVRNRSGRRVSSGVYFYHIESGNARRVGRFTVINDRPGL